MIDLGELLLALTSWLPRQRWYSGQTEPTSIDVVDHEIVGDGFPMLLRLLVQADGSHYQVVVGLRARDEHPEFLRGQDQAVIGDLSTDVGEAIAYDAVFDTDLALVILRVVAPDQAAVRVRLMGAEQSNTSLVYDERVILKLFRRVQPGHNPEVEVTEALGLQGFTSVAAPLATLRAGEFDLAILQPFLAGASEGWSLALTSLRDLFGMHDTQSVPAITFDAPPPSAVADPAQAGGDFSGEAARLGAVTAGMHVALAEAFGRQRVDPKVWATSIARQLEAVGPLDVDKDAALAILDRLAEADPGPAIRVHGDYHLGQVLRTDTGWYVLDFEGEPARTLEERRSPTSPLKDVAGMLRSFHYASAVARTERDGEELDELASAWERRNRDAFLRGYMRVAVAGGVLPADEEDLHAVLAAFELEKAIYELGYERAYRPDWEAVPLAALRRLTS